MVVDEKSTVGSERTVHLRTCPLCEAMCGLEVHVEDEQVELIRADRDDVWARGYICPKGTTLGHLHHDPDRVAGADDPRRRRTWREATWDEAFARCEELLHGVHRAPRAASAITAYIGNPTAHNFSLGRYVGILVGLSGCR